MSQSCAITKCNRTSRGVCDCCKQNLCLQHLNEHNASLISQLNPLTDQINALGDRLKTLNIPEILSECRRKLEQWRDDCHQTIDHFFQQKCQELDRLIAEKVVKQREEIIRTQSKASELIRDQETTHQEIDLLTSTIRDLETKMKNVEQTYVNVDILPLMIDNNLIHITEINERTIDLSTLSAAYKTINYPDLSFVSLASNDRFLLLHRTPNLCLVDREINVVKEVLWTHDHIYDMCWCSTLNRFIVVGGNNIFPVDENRMLIDDAKTEKRNWLSCTCSDTNLFLLTDENVSHIIKFSLLPSIELVKRWKSSHICAKDEGITNIVYNNRTISLMIINKSEKFMSIELRSPETLSRIWSLRLDIVCNQIIAYRCCSLTCNEWLVIDYETQRLLQITKDGEVKSTIRYSTIPYHAILFSENVLAVLKKDGINFHTL